MKSVGGLGRGRKARPRRDPKGHAPPADNLGLPSHSITPFRTGGFGLARSAVEAHSTVRTIDARVLRPEACVRRSARAGCPNETIPNLSTLSCVKEKHRL